MLHRFRTFAACALFVVLAISGTSYGQSQQSEKASGPISPNDDTSAVVSTPEIDPTSLVSGLALLAAGGTLIHAQLRRKVRAQ